MTDIVKSQLDETAGYGARRIVSRCQDCGQPAIRFSRCTECRARLATRRKTWKGGAR